MKTLITGLIIISCGILFTRRLHSSKPLLHKQHRHVGVRQPASPEHFFYPFMIPVGLIIATAGAGSIWSKTGKQKKH